MNKAIALREESVNNNWIVTFADLCDIVIGLFHLAFFSFLLSKRSLLKKQSTL